MNKLKNKLKGKLNKTPMTKSQMYITCEDPYEDYGVYTEGTSLTRHNMFNSSLALVEGTQGLEPSFYSIELNPRETLFVNIELYSKHQHNGNVLLFTLVVVLDPDHEKDCDQPTKHGLQIIGKHLAVLKTRNEMVKISLLKHSFPRTVRATGTQHNEKIISDDILWEKKPLETEFSFILDNVAKRDLKDIFFSGALNISHGNNSLLCLEPSLFIENQVIEGSIGRNLHHQRGVPLAYPPSRPNHEVRVKAEPRGLSPYPVQSKNFDQNEAEQPEYIFSRNHLQRFDHKHDQTSITDQTLYDFRSEWSG